MATSLFWTAPYLRKLRTFFKSPEQMRILLPPSPVCSHLHPLLSAPPITAATATVSGTAQLEQAGVTLKLPHLGTGGKAAVMSERGGKGKPLEGIRHD